MRAVVIEEYGGNDVVHVRAADRPQPGAGEVLLEVHAAGVNPVDWKIRSGAGRRMGMTLPIRLGSEVAGTVAAVGADVSRFKEGDAVFGIVKSGGFADYVAVAAADMAFKPASADFVHAVAVPLGALTAWQAMFDLAGLAAGQRLLVVGGAGGVGALAVQLARFKGAHVTAVASGRHEGLVRALGAEAFIDYARQPFEHVAHGMDVVFDTVGGDSFARAFATLRPGGVLVTAVAFPTDEDRQRGHRVERVQCKPDAGQLASIAGLVDGGMLAARLGPVLPLAEVRQALALSEAGHGGGKIVLQVAP